LQDLEALAAPTITLSEAKAQEPEFIGVRPYVPPVDESPLVKGEEVEVVLQTPVGSRRKQRAKKGI
jgi:hypothetical protein